MLNRLEVDQAVFYALVVRAWQFLAGPITMLLIASYFTPDVQGYYYTFASLLALQAFVELGLEGVIVYVASHERASLHLDEHGALVGDGDALSRLVSLGHFAFVFFAIAGALFSLVIGVAGYYFFSSSSITGIDWVRPWIAVVTLTGCSIALIPFTALLRGCHQMAIVNQFLSAQAITGNLAIWACIPLGAQLWSAVAVAAVKLFWEAALVFRFRRFFRPFAQRPTAACMPWRDEVWPLQWRMAVQGVFGYFAASLMTPVMFHYHGAAAAGQMGMTWTALMTLQYSAIAWVWTRAPQFGTLVSQRNYVELDRMFNRVVKVSFALLAIGGVILCACVWLINVIAQGGGSSFGLPHIMSTLAERIAPRLLSPLPTLLLGAGVVLNHIPLSLTIYLRSHKRDPLLPLSVILSAAIGMLVWQLGSRQGALGAAWGYLLVVALISVPGAVAVFLRCRRDWHSPAFKR